MNYETDRLLLRKWKQEDLLPFSKINSDPRVMEFMPNVLTTYESDKVAERIMEGFNLNGFGLWAVELKSENKFIGFVGLNRPSFETFFTPCVEIAWRLDYNSWGQGFATEAAKKSLEIGFMSFHLNEIVSFTVPQNIRSIGVMEKIGMKRNPSEDFDHPKITDRSPLKKHVLYRVAKADWELKS